MKKTVESNWNQISDDEWEVEDMESVVDRFSDWINSQVDPDKKIKSAQKDGKLFIRIDDIVLTNPDDPDQTDLLLTIKNSDSSENYVPSIFQRYLCSCSRSNERIKYQIVLFRCRQNEWSDQLLWKCCTMFQVLIWNKFLLLIE